MTMRCFQAETESAMQLNTRKAWGESGNQNECKLSNPLGESARNVFWFNYQDQPTIGQIQHSFSNLALNRLDIG